jgi:hypothetical protein
MAGSVLTFFINNPQQSGISGGLLDLNQPTASTSTTAWTVGKTAATVYSRQSFGVKQAATTFAATAQPSDVPFVSSGHVAEECWRTSAATTGVFSAGTWYSGASMIAVAASSTGSGNISFRIWRCTNADGRSTGSSLASDSFNRANENPLSGGGVWQTASGHQAMKIVSNVAVPVSFSGSDSGSYYSGINWPNDQYSKAKLSIDGTAGTGHGVCLMVRMSTTTNTHYRLVSNHTTLVSNVQLGKWVNNTFTALQSNSVTWNDGDTWELRVQGTLLRVFLNGIQVGTDVTDSAITQGYPGIEYSTVESNCSIDDWEGGVPPMTEITQGRMLGTKIGNLSTTVAQTSSASTQVASFSLNNEYLFLQTAWEITAASGSNSADVNFRMGPISSAVAGSFLATSAFSGTVAAGGGGVTPAGFYLHRKWYEGVN